MVMVRIIIFSFLLILGWTFMFMTGVRHSFRKEYKKYREKLFSGSIKRPSGWKLSRPRNRNLFLIYSWTSAAFLILAILVGINIHETLILLMLTVIIPLGGLLPLGIVIGKKVCRKEVKQQCSQFQIEFEEV